MGSDHVTFEALDLLVGFLGGVIVCIIIPLFKYWFRKIEILERRVKVLENVVKKDT